MLIMESRIPPEHMLAIGERLLDGSHAIISKDTIRSVLRSLNLQVYIEKWLQIIERCTGIIPPCPGPVILERLDQHSSVFNLGSWMHDFCSAALI